MRFEVTNDDTATAVGSGDVAVLATPRLIAWMEAATLEAAAPFLTDAQTSVGTAIRVEHRRPTPIGGTVEVIVELLSQPSDRHLTFAVKAIDGLQKVIGIGEIDRAVVNRARFLQAVGESAED